VVLSCTVSEMLQFFCTPPICLLAELLSLLIPVLEAVHDEAAAIRLGVNWNKTKSRLWELISQVRRYWTFMDTRLQSSMNLFILVP